jgi:hypothetical protein
MGVTLASLFRVVTFPLSRLVSLCLLVVGMSGVLTVLSVF